MTSKTCKVAQKYHGRQLNTKLCSIVKVPFLFFLSLSLSLTFSSYVHMHTWSLIPKLLATGTRLAHTSLATSATHKVSSLNNTIHASK